MDRYFTTVYPKTPLYIRKYSNDNISQQKEGAFPIVYLKKSCFVYFLWSGLREEHVRPRLL